MRLSFIFVLCFVFGFQVQGQTIRFGIQAGLNLASLDAKQIINSPSQHLQYSPMESFNVGAHFGFIMSKGIGFSVEPGLNRKGTIVKYESVSQQIEQFQFYKQLYYLTLPIIIDYYPVPRFYLSGGLEASYLIENNEIAKTNTDIKLSGDANLRKDDTSLILGMGFRINKAFEIMTRYGHGLWQLDGIFKENVVSNAFDDKSRHYTQYMQLLFKVNINALNDPTCNTGWRSN